MSAGFRPPCASSYRLTLALTSQGSSQRHRQSFPCWRADDEARREYAFSWTVGLPELASSQPRLLRRLTR